MNKQVPTGKLWSSRIRQFMGFFVRFFTEKQEILALVSEGEE